MVRLVVSLLVFSLDWIKLICYCFCVWVCRQVKRNHCIKEHLVLSLVTPVVEFTFPILDAWETYTLNALHFTCSIVILAILFMREWSLRRGHYLRCFRHNKHFSSKLVKHSVASFLVLLLRVGRRVHDLHLAALLLLLERLLAQLYLLECWLRNLPAVWAFCNQLFLLHTDVIFGWKFARTVVGFFGYHRVELVCVVTKLEALLRHHLVELIARVPDLRL